MLSHPSFWNTTRWRWGENLICASVNGDGKWGPWWSISRGLEHVYTKVYGKANSANAAEFLRELIENDLCKACSIYVDDS